MGYEARFDYFIKDAVANPEKIKKLNELLKNDLLIDTDKLVGFYNAEVILDDKNRITKIHVEENPYKFYDDEFFAKKLSKCIVSGHIDLVFYGEDGASWGFRVSKGKTEEVYPVWMTKGEYNEYEVYKQMKKTITPGR